MSTDDQGPGDDRTEEDPGAEPPSGEQSIEDAAEGRRPHQAEEIQIWGSKRHPRKPPRWSPPPRCEAPGTTCAALHAPLARPEPATLRRPRGDPFASGAQAARLADPAVPAYLARAPRSNAPRPAHLGVRHRGAGDRRGRVLADVPRVRRHAAGHPEDPAGQGRAGEGEAPRARGLRRGDGGRLPSEIRRRSHGLHVPPGGVHPGAQPADRSGSLGRDRSRPGVMAITDLRDLISDVLGTARSSRGTSGRARCPSTRTAPSTSRCSTASRRG
jgi:hypothetical protein